MFPYHVGNCKGCGLSIIIQDGVDESDCLANQQVFSFGILGRKFKETLDFFKFFLNIYTYCKKTIDVGFLFCKNILILKMMILTQMIAHN